ncbi:hypothetical protein LRP50_24235 [Enterovibrio sp. ZSDZ42]|uniref:Chromosome partitioning protein ParA n=1 Tax=Enterovibrio gelatinilyticus TaxID=2899819 RepID=A0ABT5R7K4_9GAMM|nr:hypothetical protein [Enterovibrio sp. ZSDZ42]MDD1796233.1 hypothetical protein [Enterovibrio sp. ZSDZ42]
MNFKTSLLAASVALILAGCGSDDSTPVVGGGSTGGGSQVGGVIVGQFIDAKVEGLYYESQPSGLTGWTDAKGEYRSKSGDTITFYLGGKNGLKIGASSERGDKGVISPFESTGKYERSAVLARLLQSIDQNKADNDIIVVPNLLRENIAEATLNAVGIIQLDDFASTALLMKELNIPAGEWVSEEDAMAHMSAALDIKRGGTAQIDAFKLDSGTVIRNIGVSQTKQNTPDGEKTLFVHADKTMDADLFEDTRGMSLMLLKLQSDGLNLLAGSTDSGLSEYFAQQYLTCLKDYPKATWVDDQKDENDNDIRFCDMNNNNAQDTGEDNFPINSAFDMGHAFAYKMLKPDSAQQNDELLTDSTQYPEIAIYECAKAGDKCTPEYLNVFSDNVRDDTTASEAANGDAPSWQREIESGSYDPVTGIYSAVSKKTKLEGDDCDQESSDCTEGRTTISQNYYYPVTGAEEERYVDMKGSWEIVSTRPDCETVAKSVLTFAQDGFTLKGNDFTGECSLESIDESGTWEKLPGDYWWFGQPGRELKATLTELNSTVRWCDITEEEDYTPGGECINNQGHSKEFFNKWEYQPAGKDWDMGILTSRKMKPNGETETVHYMQKVAN